jgi:hypothetical protein
MVVDIGTGLAPWGASLEGEIQASMCRVRRFLKANGDIQAVFMKILVE